MPHAIFVSFYPYLIPRHELMADTMRQRGWRVTEIVWNRREDAAKQSAGRIAIDLPAGQGSYGLLLKLPALYRRMREVIDKLQPDLVFLTHFFLLPLARLCSRANIVKIYDAPEYFCMDIAEYFSPFHRLARPVIRQLESRFLKSVDGVLVVDSRNGWFEEYYRKQVQPVKMILNVPALEKSEAVSCPATESSRGTGGRKIVAYAGSFKNSKGLATILQVVDSVRKKDESVLFEFIGSWQTDPAAVESMIKRNNLGDHVRFTGPYSYRETVQRLCAARVGLALLQGERIELAGSGCSRKVFTYMHAGIPIVASDSGQICSLVEATGCGVLVDVNSVEAVSDSICQYLADEELSRRHGARGRKAIEERYNWEQQVPAFLSFVDSLARR